MVLAALVALIVQATSGEAGLVGEAKTALWWLAAAITGAALALGAWALERRDRAADAGERDRLRAAAEDLRAVVADRDAEITRLRSTLAGRDDEIRALRAEVADREAELERLRGEVADREAQLDGVRGELADRDAELARLREEVEATRSQLAERDAKIARLIADVEQLREQIAAREEEVATAKDRANRFSRRDEREREVNRQLRRQIADLQAQHGPLGDWQDIRTLVLRMTMSLVEADKGMLLSRDSDGDGDIDEHLELVAHEGFAADPSQSELAQRFGHEVLERDRIVREDHPGAGDSRADDEIDNLVAIPIYVRDRFSGVVVCANRREGFEQLDDEVLLALGDQAGAALHNQQLHNELRRSYVGTIRVLAEAIQAKDPFLRGHSDEVSDYVKAVAERMGIDGPRREQLVVGSLLHDVGKIGISERILHKPAALTPEEFDVIRLHPRIGFRLVEQVASLRPIAPAILHHHERFDGGGYPNGLVGEQIPLEARIVCVADAFSAMTADRPYRARMPLEAACEELERHAGTQFDPDIVRVFVEEVRKQPIAEHDHIADALDDDELQMHREPDEPVLGAAAVALTDSVTLLYGHRYLHETAAAEAERSRLSNAPFAVLLVHIVEVEHVNRVDGYAAGDAHLRTCARSLSRLAVRLGAAACRDGGLTLGLVVPGTRDTNPDVLAADARDALRGCGAIRLSVECWQPGDSGETVIERARYGLTPQAAPSV